MPFENLDKKIKEAADQHHPAYDEKAWQKMEKLLNEHLPQPRKDRRRTIFFLLLALLVGGGGFILISRPWEKDSKTALQPAQESKTAQQPDKQSKKSAVSATDLKDKDVTGNTGDKAGSLSFDGATGTLEKKDKILIANAPKHMVANQSQLNKQQIKKAKDVISTADDNNKNRVEGRQDSNKPKADNSNDIVSKQNQKPEDATPINKPDAGKDAITPVNENTNAGIAKGETKRIAQKKTGSPINRNGFSFSVSLGPDVSKVGDSKTGKTTLAYGAGIGYTRNRFTLRTGVYASRKVYWAKGNYYKLSYTPPPTLKFEGADANCYVIEIPIKLSYNFSFQNKSNWFAGAGLSSYLMKREKYIYVYKTSTGGSTSYKHDISNENKHYFSVLNLSGGYTRQLNKTLSLSAEPYVEIPLTGIGAGKVHLNSGGVLFTLGVKPFKK
jgi:hypothetical protein